MGFFLLTVAFLLIALRCYSDLWLLLKSLHSKCSRVFLPAPPTPALSFLSSELERPAWIWLVSFSARHGLTDLVSVPFSVRMKESVPTSGLCGLHEIVRLRQLTLCLAYNKCLINASNRIVRIVQSCYYNCIWDSQLSKVCKIFSCLLEIHIWILTLHLQFNYLKSKSFSCFSS